jgi:hypothetical protein
MTENKNIKHISHYPLAEVLLVDRLKTGLHFFFRARKLISIWGLHHIGLASGTVRQSASHHTHA